MAIKLVQKFVGKNLTRAQAMLKFPYRKSMGDKRAFSYDPKTGKAGWL